MDVVASPAAVHVECSAAILFRACVASSMQSVMAPTRVTLAWCFHTQMAYRGSVVNVVVYNRPKADVPSGLMRMVTLDWLTTFLTCIHSLLT